MFNDNIKYILLRMELDKWLLTSNGGVRWEEFLFFQKNVYNKNFGSKNQVKDVVNSSTNWSCGSERAFDGRRPPTASLRPSAVAV